MLAGRVVRFVDDHVDEAPAGQLLCRRVVVKYMLPGITSPA